MTLREFVGKYVVSLLLTRAVILIYLQCYIHSSVCEQSTVEQMFKMYWSICKIAFKNPKGQRNLIIEKMIEETCCCHMGYSFWLAARVLLYAPSHRQDSTYHGLSEIPMPQFKPCRRITRCFKSKQCLKRTLFNRTRRSNIPSFDRIIFVK